MYVIIALVVILASIYYFWLKPFSYWKKLGIPQTSPLPIVGDLGTLLARTDNFPEITRQLYNQHGDQGYSGFYQFLKPFLLLKDPEIIKKITIKDFDHFVDHRQMIAGHDILWSKNLFASKGQDWKNKRQMMSPSFTGSKMKALYPLVVESAQDLVKFFEEKNEKVVEMCSKDVFSRFTTDVIASIAFGVKIDSLRVPNNEIYTTVKSAMDVKSFYIVFKLLLFILVPGLFKIFKVSIFPEKVQKFFKNIITESIAAREKNGITRPDLVQLFLDARKAQKASGNVEDDDLLSDDGLTAQAFLFFIGGYETVSSLMTFLVYELAAHPDCQDRLREEIQSAWKESNGNVSYDTLMNLKYLDMCISETLRLWPSMTIVDRLCTKSYTMDPSSPNGKPFYMKENTSVIIPTYAIHRDPKYFPEPDRFDPERFNEENAPSIDPYTYMPFGVGPRNCIGARYSLLKVKACIFFLLKSFKIVPTKNSQIPLKLYNTFTMTVEDGCVLGLEKL